MAGLTYLKYKSLMRENTTSEVIEAVLGKAIKAERKRQGLTQEQLGERMGVQKAQVSKIENGKQPSFSSINRAFKALSAKTASIDLGDLGRVDLW